jgi:excinuclease ABC subunit C
MLKPFDRKFGQEFLATLPRDPGVYRIFDAAGKLIYVGKAKSLRRRLSQYRNAKRRKKHHKMRAIVADSDRIEVEVCATHLDALLLEARLIQTLRPKWNVAGAFHFLYPMIGLCRRPEGLYFCYTTIPEKFPEFSFHGAFRSRDITREAFDALEELLRLVATPVARSRIYVAGGFARRDRYSKIAAFQALPEEWEQRAEAFLRGESRDAMGDLVLALVESPRARRSRKIVQRLLNQLKRFWKHEALALARARKALAHAGYPVTQQERDSLFLRYREGEIVPRRYPKGVGQGYVQS